MCIKCTNIYYHIYHICTIIAVTVQSLSHAWLFVIPWTVACQASLFSTVSQILPKFMSTETLIPSNSLITCHPLVFLPSIFPNIRVSSNESALGIRWVENYWSFSISPSNEYSELVSFRIYRFGLLAVQETLGSLLQHHSSKAYIFWHSAFFISSHIRTWLLDKTIALTVQNSLKSDVSVFSINFLGLS